MDIEWGKDGVDGKLYILQARPETVKSQAAGQGRAALQAQGHAARCWPTGRAIGQKIGTGPVRVVHDRRRDGPRAARRRARRRHDRPELGAGDEARRARSSPTAAGAPATRRSSRASSAFRRSSAAATRPTMLKDGTLVTVSCAEGDTGYIYDGLLETEVTEVAARRAAVRSPVKIMMNVGNPQLRVRLRAAAERRRRPGAARVHHQQQHRRAPEGDPRLSEHRRRPEEGGRVAWRAATRRRARSTSTSWPKASRPSPPRSGPSR